MYWISYTKLENMYRKNTDIIPKDRPCHEIYRKAINLINKTRVNHI